MKIAVYAICKDEEQHVDRFMDSVESADEVCVLDTGSSDATVERLRARGARVFSTSIVPWRFDVARNESLRLVSDDVDVCVCIDLDEVLSAGWRECIERDWTSQTTALQYNYVWSHRPDGSAAVTFFISKIHARRGYRWAYPVHEVLEPTSHTVCTTRSSGIVVHHYPDSKKPRSYLPLLELAAAEDPLDDRSSHYLGREYMLQGMYEPAIKELVRHLGLDRSTWVYERAASMRFIARCYTQLGLLQPAKQWALRAVAETPAEREPWWELCVVAYALSDFRLLYSAATMALSTGTQGLHYIADAAAWGWAPYDYAALGAFHIGFIEDARRLGAMAVAVAQQQGSSETDLARLKTNLQFYLGV